jgi:hypothetical protein
MTGILRVVRKATKRNTCSQGTCLRRKEHAHRSALTAVSVQGARDTRDVMWQGSNLQSGSVTCKIIIPELPGHTHTHPRYSGYSRSYSGAPGHTQVRPKAYSNLCTHMFVHIYVYIYIRILTLEQPAIADCSLLVPARCGFKLCPGLFRRPVPERKHTATFPLYRTLLNAKAFVDELNLAHD